MPGSRRSGSGTWQFGSKEWGYGPDYARTTAAAIVNRALDLGVNLVDTAEIYGMGASERIVGQAIASRREQVFVASKVFPVLPIPPVVEWRAVESAAPPRASPPSTSTRCTGRTRCSRADRRCGACGACSRSAWSTTWA